MPDLVNTKQPLTDMDIDEFQKLFLTAVPDSFKAYYKDSNGGNPSGSFIERGLWALPVCGFYSIKHGELKIEDIIHDIGPIQPDDKEYGRWIEYEFLPFAYDFGGNPIFLSLRKEDYGRIYLFAPDGKNIFEVSECFENFLRRLYK